MGRIAFFCAWVSTSGLEGDGVCLTITGLVVGSEGTGARFTGIVLVDDEASPSVFGSDDK